MKKTIIIILTITLFIPVSGFCGGESVTIIQRDHNKIYVNDRNNRNCDIIREMRRLEHKRQQFERDQQYLREFQRSNERFFDRQHESNRNFINNVNRGCRNYRK